MANEMKADRYAVFGNPVGHSLSPQIHDAFAEQLGQRIVYERVLVERGGFAEAARRFFDGGGRGLNVTLPFKGDAFEFVGGRERSERAKLARAVNTLSLDEGGRICGDNTDGIGLVRDLTENLGWEIANKRVLVLGAGGAVRGVLGPLLEQGPEELVIVNRTGSKAEDLVKELEFTGRLNGGDYNLLSEEDRPYDLILNGTSASLTGDLPPLPAHLVRGTRCYDMMYGTQPTAFMNWAKKHRAKEVTDGLGMLVEQAAESFHIWRGAGPNTKPVIAQLRNSLKAG